MLGVSSLLARRWLTPSGRVAPPSARVLQLAHQGTCGVGVPTTGWGCSTVNQPPYTLVSHALLFGASGVRVGGMTLGCLLRLGRNYTQATP